MQFHIGKHSWIPDTIHISQGHFGNCLWIKLKCHQSEPFIESNMAVIPSWFFICKSCLRSNIMNWLIYLTNSTVHQRDNPNRIISQQKQNGAHFGVIYWCTVGCGTGALWGLWNRSIDSLNICFWLANLKMVGIKILWIEKIFMIEIGI